MTGRNPAATVETVFMTSGWAEAERAVFTTLAVEFKGEGKQRGQRHNFKGVVNKERSHPFPHGARQRADTTLLRLSVTQP